MKHQTRLLEKAVIMPFLLAFMLSLPPITRAQSLPEPHHSELLNGLRVLLWNRPGDVAVIAAWGLAGAIVAARRFRWEPQEG